LNIFIAQAGGLHATYYDDGALTGNLALAMRTDATIDFSGDGDVLSAVAWPGVTDSPINGGDFGVRWRGFIRAPYDDIYTMSMKIGAQDIVNFPTTNDRIRVWIDNTIVIEQWSSLSSLAPSGTFNFLVPEYLYDITVEYKNFNSLQQAVLMWNSRGSYQAAACEFPSPSPAPPSYDIGICGWRLESECDSGMSICLQAQTKIPYSSTSSSGSAQFGSSVAFVGDLDADGVLDVVVGAPSDDVVGTDVGAMYILFLTTSGAIKTLPQIGYVKITQNSNMGTCTNAASSLAANDMFGTAVASMDDLDKNGYTDTAVASKSAVYPPADNYANISFFLSYVRIQCRHPVCTGQIEINCNKFWCSECSC